MFEALPKARADLKSGTLYALFGEGSWIYYGQVTADKSVGFFHRRDRNLTDMLSIFSSPVMAVVTVAYPSITRALRAGRWKKIGYHELAPELQLDRPVVQWPVGTLSVTVWQGKVVTCESRIEDPEIQNLEVMAVWDAEHHIPERLTADFGEEEADWHVGGPVWRERKVKEEMAKRFPDQLNHQLPSDWVASNIH